MNVGSVTPAAGAERTLVIRFAQDDFDEFARLSGDDNPIHVDPGYAAGTHFGATVAHGMLLFSRLAAAVGEWLDGAPLIRTQSLVFPAPTFANADYVARLRIVATGGDGVRIGGVIVTQDGTVTAESETVVTAGGSGSDVASRSSEAPSRGRSFGGLELGMAAQAEHLFDRATIEDWCRLVGDRNPRHRGAEAEVPPPLLGGLVSKLLGVDLPGPGTNWLKQRYVFGRPVPAGATVTGRVEIVRLRPEKALVNLRTTCTFDGTVVVDGEALVLAASFDGG